MAVEYIYTDGYRIWSDQDSCWCFSSPLHDHAAAEAIYELGFDAQNQIKLVVMPDGYSAMELQGDGLRRLLAGADEEQFAILSRAAQVATWHKNHCFCPRCGNGLGHHSQDLAKECVACGLLQYPRISPCIITLVTDGDYCLLAHGVRFSEPRYSTLAGFIEAGESAEAAVAREVKEEVGVDIKNIRYFKSQSWPFPHALMLGFFADYAGGDIVPQASEIVDAQWFHYNEMPDIPLGFSISRQLIDMFVEQKKLQR
ncbi:MAG: NAD(+) diphosphatase [Amphritea sp.]